MKKQIYKTAVSSASRLSIPIAVLMLAGACITLSTGPFYTAGNSIATPSEILGSWQMLSEHGQARDKIPPWQFTDKIMTAEDEHGNTAKFASRFFQVADQLFLDTFPESPRENQCNRFWVYQVYPMHHLCRVSLEKDQLILIPLNAEWLNDMVKAGKISLTRIKPDPEDEFYIYTASPEQWHEFLLKFGDNNDAFHEKLAYKLKRVR